MDSSLSRWFGGFPSPWAAIKKVLAWLLDIPQQGEGVGADRGCSYCGRARGVAERGGVIPRFCRLRFSYAERVTCGDASPMMYI